MPSDLAPFEFHTPDLFIGAKCNTKTLLWQVHTEYPSLPFYRLCTRIHLLLVADNKGFEEEVK